jgi:hypothetical protein
MFSSSSAGTYNVYLKVTDKNGMVAQSATATVSVTTETPSVPVGGYSISLVKQTPMSPVAMYATLIVLFGLVLSFTKRKRK